MVLRPQLEPYLIVYVSGKTKWCIQVGNTRYDYPKYLARKAGIRLDGKIIVYRPEYDFINPPTLDDIEIITERENEKRSLITGQPKEIQKLIRSLLPLTFKP